MRYRGKTSIDRMCFIFSIILAGMLLGGCSEKHSHMPPPQILSEQQRGSTIRQLQAVKELDWSDASDPRIGAAAREDFLEQARKAEVAIRQLQHGFAVPRTQLKDALWVPPRSLSPEQRTQLIKRVQQAEQQTDQNEQHMLTDWFHADWPADTAAFDRQKNFDDSVIKDLEIGEEVRWSRIKEAMQVPKYR